MLFRAILYAAITSAVMLIPPSVGDITNGVGAAKEKSHLRSRSVAHSDRGRSDPQALKLDTVNQQSGYLDVPSGNSLFYWYFESRENPSEDPVLIWLNGGPGCSSLEAILFENGPSNMDEHSNITYNPYSWNEVANVLYIDNPAGVGFSLDSDAVSDTVTASDDFKGAIKAFYLENPHLKNNSLHLSGESYAGRYIPVFAEAVNTDDSSPVKITSVMIGNGEVNPVAVYQSYQPMLCGKGGYPPVLNETDCERLKQETSTCVDAMTQCMNELTDQLCLYAQAVCANVQAPVTYANPYDIRSPTCQSTKTGTCYPAMDKVQDYFNQEDVQSALGANADGEEPYRICNTQIQNDFYSTNDPFEPSFHNVTNLLEQGTPVLIYNGDSDLVINWLGSRQWTYELEWKGQPGFQKASREPHDWKPEGQDGKKRGEITNYENFTFLRVADAGHMVPHDQPESAAYMVKAWISGDYAFTRNYGSI